MDRDRQIVGLVYAVISIILTPIYTKIIHILLWNSEFRKLRCYQIMAQIGVIDCVFVLGYATFGITLTFKSDFGGITFVVVQLVEAVWMVKVSLNLVLAVNRLTVTCKVKMPGWLHWVQIAYCWLLGLFYIVICLSPYTGIRIDYDFFGWGYDFNKPYTPIMRIVDITYATVAMGTCFVMYLLAAFLLFRKRRKFTTINTNLKAETRICVMAVVLFSSPMLGDVLWNFAFDFLPATYWTCTVISVISICNIALVAPTVHLVMSRSLRRTFFRSGLLGYQSNKSRDVAFTTVKLSCVSVARPSGKPFRKTSAMHFRY